MPPLAAGAVHVTVAEALPAVTGPIVGAAGTVTGVTAAERAEAGPIPPALVAATENVYAVPLVRPGTSRLVEVAGVVRVCAGWVAVSYTHLRAHETPEHLVCRLL